MTNGMSEKEYQNRIREIFFIFFAAPASILVGMFVIGSIIDNFLNTISSFSYLFSAAGGIPGIAFYYAREWKRFVNREVSKNEILENQKKILETLDDIKKKI